MARTNPDAPPCIYNFNCSQQAFVVGQGFAHPHEHNIVNFLTTQILHAKDLLDDLPHFEVSCPSFQSTCTKLAAESAANLRRDANRLAIGSRSIERRARWNQH